MPEVANHTAPVHTKAPAAENNLSKEQDLVRPEPDRDFDLRRRKIQPKLAVGAPDDPYEREADTMADTVMRMPEKNFVQLKCAECEKEEQLQRKNENQPQCKSEEQLQRKPISETFSPFIQRSLSVPDEVPADVPATDISRTIPIADKRTHFNNIIQGLCSSFAVDQGTGQVVATTNPAPTPAALSTGAHPLGCCGINILVNGVNDWKIEMSQLQGPHTFEPPTATFVLPPPGSPIHFGNFTAAGGRTDINDVVVAGHEMIGHGAQMELDIHNQGNEDRESFNHHDPTVRVQNILAHEQGIPASQDRGSAASGIHRGESYARVEIDQFEFNSHTIPASEQAKLALFAQYIITNNTWVDIIGHSDPVGSDAAKQQVSQDRADAVQAALLRLGVTTLMTRQLPTYTYTNRRRFTRVTGVSDTQPPLTGADDDANWRRVEIFAATHPAGAEVPPRDIPALQPATPGAGLATERASTDPCHQLLVNSAFPVPAAPSTTAPVPASATSAAPALQPKLSVGAQDSMFEKEADSMADKVMRTPDTGDQTVIYHQHISDPAAQRPRDTSAPAIRRAPQKDFIQQKCAHCQEEEQLQRSPLTAAITPFIQAKAASDTPAVSDALSHSIESSKGNGSSMDSSTSSFMSDRFGADFSDIKIHTDGESAQMNRSLNAKAFTTGRDIYFNEGQYQPGSDSGKHLLAHELTHVVQQNATIQREAMPAIQRKEIPVIQRKETPGLQHEETPAAQREKIPANAQDKIPANPQNKMPVIRRKVNPDEEKNDTYEQDGLNYKNAIAANSAGWEQLYKFYNIFLKKEIFPGSQAHAYANHVFEIQKYLIKTFPQPWADHPADGILDTKTLSTLLVLAAEYAKDKENTDLYEGLDLQVLERLSSIQKTNNPPLQSGYLKGVYQFQLVNDYGFAIEIGSKGDYVTVLQKALLYLHYPISDKEVTDTKFGPDTKEALKSFQRDAGLEGKKVDGRFGQQTLRLLDTLLAQKGSVLVLPGITSYIEGNLRTGLEMFIDGDGDQRKELRLKFTSKNGSLSLTITHIDTKEVAGPFLFSVNGIDLGKDVTIIQTIATEGIRAAALKITNSKKDDKSDTPAVDNILEIVPSDKLKTDGKYQVKSGSQTYEAAFDPSKMVLQKVVSSDIAVEPNMVSADVKLGSFNDHFRFTLVKNNDIEDTEADEDGKGGVYHYLLKIAGVGNNGDLVFANDTPLTLSESRLYQLVFNVMEQDEISVTYDFDGDTNPDVKVNTILTQAWDDRQENKKIPETGRHITIVLTGPALADKVEKYFTLINSKFQFREIKTEAVFQGVIAAEGGKLLNEQKVPSDIGKEIAGLDATLEQFYQQAVVDQATRKETYVAYRMLKDAYASITPLLAKKEEELTEDDKKQINSVAVYADVFYDLFKEDTKDARKESYSTGEEGVTTFTDTNPFTRESKSTTVAALMDPMVVTSELHLGNEIRNHEWGKAGPTFMQIRTGYNLWVSEKVKEKKPKDDTTSQQVQAFFQYETGLQEIAGNPNNKYISRVKAIYYSWDQFLNQPGVKHIELPMYYYLDEASNEWWVVDFVRPDHPFRRKVNGKDEYKNIVRNDGKTPAPPAELFEKLDNKEHLPKGVLLYDAGQGINGRIELTEPWQWKDILGWIGLGLAVVGLAALVVLSDGAATPAAAQIFFALSAIAGGAAATIDLVNQYKDEGWDPKRAVMDVGQIVASLLSLGTLGAGRLVVVAREAAPAERLSGIWQKLAGFSDARYVTMLKMTIGTDIINFGLLTEDTLTKLNEIDKQPGDDAAKTRAKIFLVSQLLFAGGMTFFSLRGNVRGLDQHPTLILHPGPDGVPIVSDARVWLPENVHSPDLFAKITSVAKERNFPLTVKEDGLNNVESLIKGLQNGAFGQSKNAVPVLEGLLTNGDQFERTARAVAYAEKNGFAHFDFVYEGIMKVPDADLAAVKTKLNTGIKANDGFSLGLTDDEIKAIIQKGKSINLTDDEVNDFLLISSREKKRIAALDLMTQMDNWKTIQQRGFPFLFSDIQTFNTFKLEVKKLLVKYNIPNGDVQVQGSSLRTAGAKDIDMAVFVSDEQFNALTTKAREGIMARTAASGNMKLRKNLLQQLNNGIAEGRLNSFLIEPVTPGKTFNQDLYELNQFLNQSGKGFDLSVMKSSGKFVLSPALKF